MFHDRKEAGEKLGRALETYRHSNPLVLGIPRGGVETAYYVAKHLDAELSFVIARKLAFPHNPETAFGALAEDGSLFLLREGRASISPEILQKIIDREQREITRRIQVLRKGKPLPQLKGRTVLLIDDGIATGATLFASIALCKHQKAGKIIVAAPVSGNHMEQRLKTMVDDVVILSTPHFYYAVSQGYTNFYNLTDADVVSIISRWEREKVA